MHSGWISQPLLTFYWPAWSKQHRYWWRGRRKLTCRCVWERKEDRQRMEKLVRKRLSWNRPHTRWLCSPGITAVWIGSPLSLLIAYCFLQRGWRWVVSNRQRAIQEYQSLFSLLSVSQICKWIWDHLGCDFACSLIRNLCRLLYCVINYQWPERRSWSKTLHQIYESF